MDKNKMSNKNNHPLHEKIGNRIEKEVSDCEIIRSSECFNKQKIPLFCSKEKGYSTKYCDVDLLIIKDKNNKKIIIEIEESDITPIRIFGKFLASALSSYYIHKSKNNKLIDIDPLTFIQIATTLNEENSKNEQFTNIKKSIQNLIKINNGKIGKINKYEFFFGYNLESNEEKLNEIFTFIREDLNEISTSDDDATGCFITQ